jgi:16S rRNA (guanine527-N7)-methyltransferase
MTIEIIKKHFPTLTVEQIDRLEALGALYTEWNAKINLISRRDMDNLYERHIVHSMAIGKAIRFRAGTAVLDVGTGGGFPGIPLAIFFPEARFTLLDSIGKKIRVAEDIARRIGLDNVECVQRRVEDERQKFDFVVSRAVMPLADLVRVARKNISTEQRNALPNGFLCLKGGDLQAELQPFRNKTVVYDLSDWFDEDFFQTKKIVFYPSI